MSTERGRARALAFHATASALFTVVSVALVRSTTLVDPLRWILFGAAVWLALASLHAAARLLDRSLAPLPSRRAVDGQLYALLAGGVLGFVGLHLHTAVEGASAAGWLCLLSSAWIAVMGLQLVPTVFLGERLVLDGVWRAIPISQLEWFSLRSAGVTPPRARLLAGREDVVRLSVQLVGAEHDALRRRLAKAGLRAYQRAE